MLWALFNFSIEAKHTSRIWDPNSLGKYFRTISGQYSKLLMTPPSHCSLVANPKPYTLKPRRAQARPGQARPGQARPGQPASLNTRTSWPDLALSEQRDKSLHLAAALEFGALGAGLGAIGFGFRLWGS